jgi:cytochrome c oxidase subunit II
LRRLTPSHRRRRRAIVFSLFGAAVTALVVAAPASAGFILPQAGGSPNADDIQDLYIIVLVVALVIFFGVEGALLYALIKFRARKGAVPAQIRGNTRLEIGWTVGAAVILVILAVATFVKLPDINNPPNSKINTGVLVADAKAQLPPNKQSLNICVNGQQYIWRYTYEAHCSDTPQQNTKPFSYEEMVVPSGVTVTLDIVSQDVAHSWWIPNLGGKFDAIPGYTNHTWFQIPEKYDHHVFSGQCAELCGRNHADMVARVLVLPFPEWKTWLANQTKNIAAADAAAQKQLQALTRQQQRGQNTPLAGTVAPGKPQTTTTSRSPTAPPPTATAPSGNSALIAQGRSVFTGSSGCSGCHTLADAKSNGTIGPNLDKAIADATPAEIQTDIVDPNAQIAPGFQPNIMPQNFKSLLSKQQLNAVVAYLAAVAGK